MLDMFHKNETKINLLVINADAPHTVLVGTYVLMKDTCESAKILRLCPPTM